MNDKQISTLEKIVSTVVDILLGILVIIVIIVMGEAIYSIFQQVVPLKSTNSLYYLIIEEVATLFILLEIILMLLRYVRDNHHIPVRYLVLISITAILRQLLLTHGSGLETLFMAFAILVLVIVLYILEHLKSFKSEISVKQMIAKMKKENGE